MSADCIGTQYDYYKAGNRLPSPRGVRIASVSREQAYETFKKLPSPRGVRIASDVLLDSTNAVLVAVPARGADCISKRIQIRIGILMQFC